MKRLLLISHRAITQEAGPAARWRSLARRLPELGWEVDAVSAPERAGNVEFAEDEHRRRLAARRAAVMERVGRASDPAFALAGVRPDALPLSMAWLPRGAREVRRRLDDRRTTTPCSRPARRWWRCSRPRAARGRRRPRSSSSSATCGPATPRSTAAARCSPRSSAGRCARASAVVACTPEAAADLRARHPGAAAAWSRWSQRLRGRAAAAAARGPAGRPPADDPALGHADRRPPAGAAAARAGGAWPGAFRLVLHGYAAPAIEREIAEAAAWTSSACRRPSWAEAVERIAAADVALDHAGPRRRRRDRGGEQGLRVPGAGAAGALSVTDGGATEALLAPARRRRPVRPPRRRRLDRRARSTASWPETRPPPWPARAARAVRAARRGATARGDPRRSRPPRR